MVFNAQGRRRIALRIKVDNEDAGARVGQRSRKIHRGRGLAHTALLVGHRDNPSPLGEWRRGRRKNSSPTLEVAQLLSEG